MYGRLRVPTATDLIARGTDWKEVFQRKCNGRGLSSAPVHNSRISQQSCNPLGSSDVPLSKNLATQLDLIERRISTLRKKGIQVCQNFIPVLVDLIHEINDFPHVFVTHLADRA